MSLDWNVSAIVAREGKEAVWRPCPEFPGNVRLDGTLECIVWATIFVGMPTITADNWQTFAKRLRAWEKVAGCISSSGEPIRAEAVRRATGLRTNASTKTQRQFSAEVGSIAQRNADRTVSAEIAADERRRAEEAPAAEARA